MDMDNFKEYDTEGNFMGIKELPDLVIEYPDEFENKNVYKDTEIKPIKKYLTYLFIFLAVITGFITLFKSLLAFAYFIFFTILALTTIKTKFIEKKNAWVIISLTWLLFTFLGTNSLTFNLPIGLFAFRFWMLQAVAIALITPIAIWSILALIRNKTIRIAIIAVILIAIYATSGTHKYAVNTAQWGPDNRWSSIEELQGYLEKIIKKIIF